MQHPKWTVVLMFLVLSSCSGRKTWSPGTVAKWQSEFGYSTLQTRELAESRSAPCVRDQFNLESIRDRIAQRKKKAQTLKATEKTWGGIDISKFHPAEAAYLSLMKDWIRTKDMDYTGCKSLECILSKIYGDELSAAMNTLFYLRTGYGLGATSMIPTFEISADGKYKDRLATLIGASDESYIFDKDELRSFLEVSWILPSSMKFMPSLKTIHRVPRGMQLLEWEKSKTCGQYFGNVNSGWIRLGDACLILDKSLIKFHPRAAIVHEMAHAFDATGCKDAARCVSVSEEWQKLSGWKGQVPVDPAQKTATPTWNYDSAAEGFVSDYAKGSPWEDLAESVAHFVYFPDDFKANFRKKYDWISQKVFSGRSFTDPDLMEFYKKTLQDAVAAAGPKVVSQCISAGSTGNFKVDEIRSCAEKELYGLAAASINDLKSSDIYACPVIETFDGDLGALAVGDYAPQIQQLMSEGKNLAPSLRAATALSSGLQSLLDPREVYLRCYQKPSRKECYDKNIQNAVDSVASPYISDLGASIESIKSEYLSKNTFEKTEASFQEFFIPIVSGFSSAVITSAENRWRLCLESENREGLDALERSEKSLLTRPFSGGTQYVAARILNCVNSSVIVDLKAAHASSLSRLAKFGMTLSLADPDLQAYFLDVTQPSYLTRLGELLETSARSEKFENDQRSSKIKSAWLQTLSGAQITDRKLCPEIAAKSFGEAMKNLTTADRPTFRFEAKEQAQRRWLKDVCLKG